MKLSEGSNQYFHLRVLANFLEDCVREEDFNMARYFHLCGSPSCALGWCTVAFPETFPPGKIVGYYSDVVLAFFHLAPTESAHLFGPHLRTLSQEVEVIRNFILENSCGTF